MNATAPMSSRSRNQTTLCPVCGETKLREILDREQVPLFCNVLCTSRRKALQAERGRLRLLFCPTCGMIHNACFEPERMTYRGNYENAQHYSPKFQQYLQDLANRLVEGCDIRDKTVVDIGCGDARLLTLICEAGRNRGRGFDPAAPIDCCSEKGDIEIVRQLYSEEALTQSPDFICCRHVLEHIPKAYEFLSSVRRTLQSTDESRVYFEVPNTLYAIRDFAVWEFLYEHVHYFCEPSLAALFERCGFEVLSIEELFGGQFLGVIAAPTDHKQKRWNADQVLFQLADSLVGLFESHYLRTVELWTTTLRQLFAQGKEVVIWGAGTKGVMFLNGVPAAESIRYAVDVNPRKQGCFVTGSGQEIVPPAKISTLSPDVVLVMNPIYEQEIRTELAKVRSEAKVLVV